MYKCLLSVLLMGVTTMASAHYPYIDCAKVDKTVECHVGFSDGSDAIGNQVVMYSYSDDVLATAVVDDFSKVVFAWSEQEFYIQFDAGHEDPAEYDYAEL